MRFQSLFGITLLTLSFATIVSASSFGPFGCGASAAGGAQAEYGTAPYGSLAYAFNGFNNTVNGCGSSYGNSVASTGTVVDTEQTDLGPQQFAFQQDSSFSAGAHASFGSLGAFVTATASSTPQSYFYNDPGGDPQAANNNYYASANGGSDAYWTDTLRVMGNGPVQLKFTVSTSGASSTIPVPFASAIFVTQYCIDTVKYGCGLALEYPGAGSMSATETFFPGDLVYVDGILTASASAQAGWNPYLLAYNSTAFASADAFDTSLFHIDVLTSGASYVTASGASYESTPEPAGLLLFGSGILSVAGTLRRKRSCAIP